MPLLMVQQMRDGTRMQVLTTNPVHSDKGDSIAENEGSAEAQPAGAEVGAMRRAGKSPHPDLLRD